MSILKSMVKPRTITVATPQPVEDSYDKNTMQIAENKWIRACIDDLEKPSCNVRSDGNDRVLSWEFHDWDDDYYSGPVCTVDFRSGLPEKCGVLSFDEVLSYNDGGVYYVQITEPESCKNLEVQLTLAVDRRTDVLSIVPDPYNGERISLLHLDNPAALDALIRSLMVIRSTIV
jgi:hypothetical protein